MADQYPYDYRKADPIELVKLWVRGVSWIALVLGLFSFVGGWIEHHKGGFLNFGGAAALFGFLISVVAGTVLAVVPKAKLPPEYPGKT